MLWRWSNRILCCSSFINVTTSIFSMQTERIFSNLRAQAIVTGIHTGVRLGFEEFMKSDKLDKARF